MLEAHALEKAFGPKKVVEGLSFELRPGEILGLLGPNGAGKTTTVGMLYGQTLPCSGSVQIQGISVLDRPTEARKRIGIVLQEDCLDPDFSVLENLCIYALYHGIKRKVAYDRARVLIAEFQLEEYKDSVIETLSGGLQRRVSLARALMHDPELLFLDEPTVGLDPDIRQQFWRYISALRTAGKGILLTTHYMEEAERLSDRVLLLDRGRLIGQGSPAEVIQEFVGSFVVECSKIERSQLELIAKEFNTRIWSFGGATRLMLPSEQKEDLLKRLIASGEPDAHPVRASLDDVFLLIQERGAES